MLLVTSPPTNTDIVGIDMIPYLRATSGFSSMFSFTMRRVSACSAAISSSTGPTILHGPHHSAQKSTSTGRSLLSTSALNVSSVTGWVAPMGSSCCGGLLVGRSVGGSEAFDGLADRHRGCFGCLVVTVFLVSDVALGVKRGSTA